MDNQFYCKGGTGWGNEACKSCPAKNLHNHLEDGKCLSQPGVDCPPCLPSITPPDPSTALATIRVNPMLDEAVNRYAVEAQEFKDRALAQTVTSVDDKKLAIDDLSILRRLRKDIEGKRKEFTTPIDAHLKDINSAFKTIDAPLLEADQILAAKVLAFDREQARKAREAEEINRLRMEAAEKEMKLKGELSESVVLVETPPVPQKTTAGDISTGTTRQLPKFEVEDISKVPAEFLVVDMVALGKQVRAGRRNIPGVRIWIEDNLSIRAK